MAQVERDDLWRAIYEASPYNWPMPCEHFAHRQQGGWDVCAECEADGIYEAVIKHLTESGRLLPSGGEVSDQWSVRKDDPWGARVVMEPSTEEEAREYLADQLRFEEGSYRRPAELVHRQVTTWEDGSEHYTPWSPVLSDNSEVPNAD